MDPKARTLLIQQVTSRIRELTWTRYVDRPVGEIEMIVRRVVEAIGEFLAGREERLAIVAKEVAVLRASQGFLFSELMQGLNVLRDCAKQHWSREELAKFDNILPRVLVVVSETFEETQTKLGYLKALEAIALTLEAREGYSSSHGQAVQAIAEPLASWLGVPIEQAGLFHDIGKIYVPDHILTKPGLLDSSELVTLRQHPYYSFKILTSLSDHLASIVLRHHERPDGKGYPLGETTVPLEANVIAAADTWHTILSSHPYRGGRGELETLEEIRAGRGTQFLPAVVEAVEKFYPMLRDEWQEKNLSHSPRRPPLAS